MLAGCNPDLVMRLRPQDPTFLYDPLTWKFRTDPDHAWSIPTGQSKFTVDFRRNRSITLSYIFIKKKNKTVVFDYGNQVYLHILYFDSVCIFFSVYGRECSSHVLPLDRYLRILFRRVGSSEMHFSRFFVNIRSEVIENRMKTD